ncbi:MAG: GDP-mannose 4,6-dehydratase [candidate division FCPU426 bacterium]
MKLLITGMEGFVGSHLAEYCLEKKCEVHGTAFPGATLQNLARARRARVHRLDLTRADAVEHLVRRLKPRWIFHLAGWSSPTLSRRDPEAALRVNVLGNVNLLEAARRLQPPPRVLVVGSADEYGAVDLHLRAITEGHPLNPDSPYAVSKVCQDLTGLTYFREYGLPVIRVRPFNHIGPRQALGFVATDFASQIVSIEKGRRVPLMEVGNLDVVRDFSDVRDVVRAYWLLMERGRPGEVYNIGSGRGIRVRDLLDGLLRLTSVRVQVHTLPTKARKEKLRKVASIAKLGRHTGWKPRIPLAETLRAVMDDWRQRLG